MIKASNWKENKSQTYEEEEKYILNLKEDLSKKVRLFLNCLEQAYAIEVNGDRSSIDDFISNTKSFTSNIEKQLEKANQALEILKELKDSTDYSNRIQNRIIKRYNNVFFNISSKRKKSINEEEDLLLNYMENILPNLNSKVSEEVNSQIENDDIIVFESVGEDIIPIIEDNDTLLISEIQGKVFFPYSGDEIEAIYNLGKDKYKSFEDVIEANYVRPLSDFKDSYMSRVKETIKLLTKKEGYSLIEALEMSIEMFGKKYLHPAIIAACNTLDELDVYLDCLDKNEVEDFKIFKIKYEVYPIKVKGKKEFFTHRRKENGVVTD